MLKAFFILSLMFGSLSAHAYKLHQIDKVSEPWMQEIFNQVKANRLSDKGLCGSFQGAYSFELENDEDLSMGLATMITRDAMMTFNPQELDIVTSSHILMNEDETKEHIRSAFRGAVGDKSDFIASLINQVYAHEKEMDQTKEFYSGSVAYAQKNGNQGDYYHDIINHFSIVDLERKELFFIGSGQCEY